MKIKKLIPMTAIASVVAGFAPLGLSSCGQLQTINVINGYTPDVEPREERNFENYEEVTQYYVQLDKNILAQDYLWSLGEYVREKMEFPSPILPFKFVDISVANASVEDWWSQPYSDSNLKRVFYSSYGLIFKIGGTTQPRNDVVQPNSYVPNSVAILYISAQINKLPCVIKNKSVGSNTTDARWYIEPADDELLKKDSIWNVSVTATLTYQKKDGHDQTISTVDTIGVYWHKDHLYNPETDPDVSYLLPVCWDVLVYGSYHLKNCTLKQ